METSAIYQWNMKSLQAQQMYLGCCWVILKHLGWCAHLNTSHSNSLFVNRRRTDRSRCLEEQVDDWTKYKNTQRQIKSKVSILNG